MNERKTENECKICGEYLVIVPPYIRLKQPELIQPEFVAGQMVCPKCDNLNQNS